MMKSRRRFLASTAAVSVGAISGLTTRSTAQSGDYDVITVGSGETFQKRLSDGEVWENKLIDISASGASYRITATADNWVIRNIGFRGQLDRSGAPDSQNFVVRVNSSDATGVIENFYHPGTSYPRSYSPYPSGFYVHAYHEGDLEVNNFYVKDFPSHAIYGSGPGNPSSHSLPGGKGTVRIHDSFCRDMENSGWRIGTDGSYVENSVAFRTVRGVWAYYENVEIRDCDLGDNGVDIHAGNGSWGNTGTATVTNTRFDTVNRVGGGDISGSSAGTPQERVPDGCPSSPEEAASGIGGNGGGDNDGGNNGPNNDGGSDDDESKYHPGRSLDDDESVIVFSGTHLKEDWDDSMTTDYVLEVSEDLVPSTYNNAIVDDELEWEEGDSRVDHTVADWKDAFVFTGEIKTLETDGPAKVYLNGGEIDPNNYGSDDNSDGTPDDDQNDSAPPDEPNDNDDGSDNPDSDGNQDGNNDGSDDNDDSGGGDNPDFNNDDLQNMLDSLFGDGGLFDSLFGSGGVFDSFSGR